MEQYGVMSFKEFVAMKEGVLLPDRPPAKGLSRINPFPITNADKRRMKARSFFPTTATMK